MAQKVTLREFQEGLIARLQHVTVTASESSRLGVQVGQDLWLINLIDAGEVLPVPQLTAVPLTKSWFSGIVNIRGNLYSIIDLSSFLGGDAIPTGINSRLILIGEKFGINAGFLVSRMLGLRNIQQFQESENNNLSPWVAKEYKDTENKIWKELNMLALVQHPEFLQIS
jgi:twitching motility protein PilI